MRGGLVLMALLCAGLVACSGDGDSGGAETPPVSTTPATSVAPSATAPATPTGPSKPAGESPSGAPGGRVDTSTWRTDPVRVDRESRPQARLVAVRSARNELNGATVDRLVLEFRGGVPGYTIGYVDEVLHPGSGAPLPVGAPVALEVVVTPAVAHDDAGTSTLTTPPTGGGLPVLRTFALAGDFEGYVHVGLGLRERTGFRVLELTGPDRLVIDFAD